MHCSPGCISPVHECLVICVDLHVDVHHLAIDVYYLTFFDIHYQHFYYYFGGVLDISCYSEYPVLVYYFCYGNTCQRSSLQSPSRASQLSPLPPRPHRRPRAPPHHRLHHRRRLPRQLPRRLMAPSQLRTVRLLQHRPLLRQRSRFRERRSRYSQLVSVFLQVYRSSH